MPRRATNSETKLSPVNFRTTPERRARLEEKANASGRSLAQEVERLVDFALDYEERVGGEDMVAVLRIIGETAARVLSTCGGLDHLRRRARLVGAIRAAAELSIPMPDVSESEDLLQIYRDADYLLMLMPSLDVTFDPSPLLNLRGSYRVLSASEYARYLHVLESATGTYSDPDDVATIEEGIVRLEQAQLRAHAILKSSIDEDRIGGLRAFSAVREVYERRASEIEE